MTDNEQILRDEYGNRLVRRVIEHDDWAAEVILDIAAGTKTQWTPAEWANLLCDLERCQLKVIDWLEASK
jgi:hypothetical protein